MNLIELAFHPGLYLDKPAADALARFEAVHGVITINSAHRPESEQQALIDRYDHPKSIYDRPPYLYNPRRPASAGLHVKGTAIDTPDIATMKAWADDFGFVANYAYDPVHFEYESWRDKYINGHPSNYVKGDPAVIDKDEEMAYKIIPTRNDRGVDTVRVFNTNTNKDVAIPGPKNGVNYLSLVKRFLGNDGSDVMLKAETDIVVGLLNQTK